ncbi:MAG: T9SS type A sorting domain-containing protein [Candidatus Symbiothrix sp.]|jgi:hypothetical protein|nr:T9SS type A sorting domain-containing protein [Candidatus Symbiothrix sp.]
MKKIYFILCTGLLMISHLLAAQDLPVDGATYVIYNFDGDFKHILKVNEDNPTALQTLLWWNVSPEVWGSGDTDEARKNYLLEHASDFYYFKLEAVTGEDGNPLENRFYIQTKGGYISNSGEYNYNESIVPEATSDNEKLYVEVKTGTTPPEYITIQSPRYYSENKFFARLNDNGFIFDSTNPGQYYWTLVRVPEFTITLPSVTGATLAPVADGNTVFIARSYEFTLALEADYSQSAPVVTISRGGGAAETVALADGKYTITDVRTDIAVSVNGVELNRYTVTLPAVTGVTFDPATTANQVVLGNDFEFTFALDADYDNSTPEVSFTREGGEPETLTLADGKYTITNVRTAVAVNITGVVANPDQTVTLPEVTGVVFDPATTVNQVRGGLNFDFTVTLEADYDQSTVELTATREGGEPEILTLTNGKYTLTNVRTAIAVAISGVVLNPDYTVTLPVITGVTLNPATATNAVRGGHDFEFTVTLEAGYDQSTPVVTISRDGGNAETLPLAGGKYTISDVRTDIDVTITGVVPNGNAIHTPDSNGVNVYASGKSLFIASGSAPVSYTIYNIVGKTVASGTAAGETQEVSLPAGIYVVKANNASTKLIIHKQF